MTFEGGMDRREFLRGAKKAAVGLGAFVAMEAMPGSAEASEADGFEYQGFENYPVDLENTKSGLEFALKAVEKDIAENGEIFDCSKMPLTIELKKDTKAGTTVFVYVTHEGQKYKLDPQYNIPGAQDGFEKNVDALDFAQYIRNQFLESKEMVRSMCQ